MSVNDTEFVRILASIMAQSAPLLLAVTGETITERAGVINLSLDGSMMFSAMGGFVVAYVVGGRLTDAGITGHFLPVMAGLAVAALLGALVALLIAWGSIRLKRDQVAICPARVSSTCPSRSCRISPCSGRCCSGTTC